MKTIDIDEQVQERFDPYSESNRDLYAASKHEQDEFDKITQGYGKTATEADRLRNQPNSKHQPQQSAAKQAQLWQLVRKKVRGKSSLLTVSLILFGGGGALAAFTSAPSLVLVQLRETYTQSLNDQLHAFDKRTTMVMRAKLKEVTKGSCGAVRLPNCRFAKVNDSLARNLKNANIDVVRENGVVKHMTFTRPNGEKVHIPDAETYTKMSLNDPDFRSAMLKSFNPKVASVSDRVALKALKRAKASKTPQLKGDTDEERRRSLNTAVSSGASEDTNRLRPQLDEEGKETGRFIDENNNVIEAEDSARASQVASASNTAVQAGSKHALRSVVVGGLSITGVIENACTMYNASRGLSALAKVTKKYQAIRFVFGALFALADKIKAGEATEGEVITAATMAMTPTDNEKVVDESKWNEGGTAESPPEIEDPDAGKAAPDSPGFKIAAYDDVPTLDSRAARFMLGWGIVGTLDTINHLIARAVNGGNPDPREVGKKCRLVQNPFVRVGALGIGILAGAGSFGLSTAAGVAGSLAIGFALPYIMSVTADLMAGNLFKDLSGMDFGDAAFVGAAGYFGDVAEMSGMPPLSAAEAVAYTNENRQTYEKYAAIERYDARNTPLDIYNQYSFIGSFARSIMPFTYQATAGGASMAMSVAGLFPASISGFVKPVKAASSIERFQQCPDPTYTMLNIGADVFCNPRHGISEDALNMETTDNNDWMMNTSNIDATTEEGKPKDNGQKWNYVKFLKECVGRTAGWGEDQEENQGDGGNCVSEENEEVNEHFQIYTMDSRVEDALSQTNTENQPGTTGSSDGLTGDVDTTGWAWPTTSEAQVTSGFNDPNRGVHKGVDLAQPGGAALGKPIFAAYKGTVIASGPAQGFGNWIKIRHDVNGKRIDTVYGHIFTDDLLVKVGDTVTAGQQIARIGWNGNVYPKSPEGSHLHFEVWEYNGDQAVAVDPMKYVSVAKTNENERAKDR